MRRVVALALGLALLPVGARGSSVEPADLVDPFIGTLGAGFVFPGAAAPFGMVQNSPDTEGIFAYTGYQWSDQFIRGFSLVHVQSMGVQEGGQLPIMPTTGAVVTDVKRYQSKFDHAMESASPGAYDVQLHTYQVQAELAAGTRVAMDRFTFPSTADANVLFDVGRQIPGGPTDDVQTTPGTNLASVRRVDDRTIAGTANVDLTAPHGYAVHFVARFDRPFRASGVWRARGAAPEDGVDAVTGKGAGMYVRFDATADRDVVMKVGVSFVSQQNALANLEDELPGEEFDFEGLRARTRAAWNDALRAIEVTGGTAAERTAFTTALYHAQHHPNVFNDANGEYLGHDGVTHRIGEPGDAMPAGSTYYANFSLWDTYRAEMPLLYLIAPDRARDMMRTLTAIARHGAPLPRWALMNRSPDYMIGEPALQAVADAFCRGLVPADAADDLYAAMRSLAFDNAKHDLPRYRQYGYVPGDQVGVGTSTTLELASADFALALTADARGMDADRDAALSGAQSWRAVFDPETRFVRPRRADGSWVSPYYPELPDGFKEGTGWQYTWLVPHDVRGLADAMGAAPRSGDAFVQERLDTFFATPATATVPLAPSEAQQKATAFGIFYYGNQYAPSNEHDLQAPYLHSWVGQPWKTNALSRQYQGLYRATPDGLPGNDDLGTMSAWFVWSALGMYPVIPGAPVYVFSSPLFERAVVRVPGGSFTVEAPGASATTKYITGAAIDGTSSSRAWVDHDVLQAGRTLRLTMSAVPDTSFGAARADAPPSQSDGRPLSDFRCRV